MYLAIDSSYSSPGITVFDTTKYHFLSFSKVKKRIMEYEYQNFTLKVLEYPTFPHRIQNMKFIVDTTIDFLKSFNQPIEKFGIEDYSYGSVGRGETLIHEIEGIFLEKIYSTFNVLPTQIAPKSIKKFFTGNGNATKFSMIKSFEININFDWYDLLDLKQTSDNLSPLSDIADSYAICKYILNHDIKHIDVIDELLDNFLT